MDSFSRTVYFVIIFSFKVIFTAADPGFTTWGMCVGVGGGDANLLLGKIIAENCIKMKDIGPGEAGVSLASPWIGQ